MFATPVNDISIVHGIYLKQMHTRSSRGKSKSSSKPGGKMLIWLVLCGVLIFGCFSIKPILEAIQINRENARTKEQIANLLIQNQQLMKSVALMRTPMGMEIQARKLGYVRKGEHPLIVP